MAILIVLLLLCLFLLAVLDKKNRLFGFSIMLTFFVGTALVVTRNDTVVIQGETMGTTYHVSVVVPVYISWTREFRDNLLKKKIDEELTRVNALMSTYDPNSELSRLNSHQSEEPFPISADTAKVLRLALEIAQKTNGAYDPTVGPLVNLWRFGPEDRPEKVPSDEEIAAARQRVGWDKIKIVELPGSDSQQPQYAVVKSDPNVYIDLSSVAKGFGVDCVAELLTQNHYKDFLVDVGGELRSSGKNVAGKDWSVGINSPVLTDNSLAKTISLSDKAIATSGDYLNFYELDGVRYSHIIDTQTGRPITHKTASVSVIDDSCMTADAWATALLALGAEQGKPLAKENGLHVIFLVRDGEEFVVESVNQE